MGALCVEGLTEAECLADTEVLKPDSLVLALMVDGQETPLSTGILPANIVTVKVEVYADNGSHRFKVWVDGTLKINVTDSTFLHGGVAFGGPYALFDNINNGLGTMVQQFIHGTEYIDEQVEPVGFNEALELTDQFGPDGLLSKLLLPAHCRRTCPNPYGNGCSFVNNCPVSGYCFTSCCNQHDCCYDYCRAPRSTCDTQWRSCMFRVCGTNALCRIAANVYYAIVRVAGGSFYRCAGCFPISLKQTDFVSLPITE